MDNVIVMVKYKAKVTIKVNFKDKIIVKVTVMVKTKVNDLGYCIMYI